jgi:CRISPR-associated endonuclease/helicase Cas3
MAFFAHTLANQPESEWEPLGRHLAEVGRLAEANGARFGGQTLARRAGELHDLGKYCSAFQARLRDPTKRVDHSTAGAVWASRHLGQKWGKLLAHVIAGHHAGLRNDLFGAGGRIASNADAVTPVEQAARSDGFALPDGVTGPSGAVIHKGSFGFQHAFLTRMIFSCLIDADRTAAAAFDGPAGTPSAGQPSIAALDAALQAWMAQRVAPSAPLDTLRDKVLHAATARAGSPQGVFTLTVPTGGGKTLTSLAFALAHARHHGLDRVIVVIPYTSIIEQTAQVYRDALRDLANAVLEHHSAFERSDEARWSDDHTGPERLRLSMERWDSPIVVTTAVQFFESLFASRTSRCRKLHSIARSVIVVDEAQTMPLPLLRPCVAALKELALNYGASVVLCTATQPALAAPAFPGGFIAPTELAPDVPALFAALRRVTVKDIGVQTDGALAELVAAQSQALCIVNQRAHARALFQQIRQLPGARHLSTCMHSVHRARVLAEIREDLRHGRPCRVVATSLVEAGVDVDFPRVLRASAGLDQIAQAAGRCNREGKRRAEDSEVLVFTAAEYDVIQPLKVNAEAGAATLAAHMDDPFSPAAMRAFFALLYGRKGKQALDQAGVLELCEDHKGDLNFPFETIANAMRFIDETMVPVIVGKEDDGKVAGLVQSLRYAPKVGGIARQLGRYTVGVPRKVRLAMLAQRVAEAIRPDEFGDQFVVLNSLDLYSPEAGLDWRDLTFLQAANLIMV